ncbi:hypothetical protein JCGZ_21660 [Jatropha curcas]|uniref:ABC transporter domain-containing protein n=1 Tax=Jatropha curcas TaxID=180498 RepID=A0A067JNW6_JATCU|nr:hypothetical protein JCGZ_21660 [Jatropha curcas]
METKEPLTHHQKVPILKLFSFADRLAESSNQIVHINSFGTANQSNVVDQVLKRRSEHQAWQDFELKDVHFRYPAGSDARTFSGFSVKIPSGKTIALVGQSGNGKSTFVSLFKRFYDPDSRRTAYR